MDLDEFKRKRPPNRAAVDAFKAEMTKGAEMGFLGEWRFAADEMDLLGLRTGDVLGPGIVGFATDDDTEEHSK